MSSAAARKYSEAMAALEIENPKAHRAIKCRVESWKTIADKWRAQAEGRPETPSATQWRKKAEGLQFTITKLEAQIAALEEANRKEDS